MGLFWGCRGRRFACRVGLPRVLYAAGSGLGGMDRAPGLNRNKVILGPRTIADLPRISPPCVKSSECPCQTVGVGTASEVTRLPYHAQLPDLGALKTPRAAVRHVMTRRARDYRCRTELRDLCAANQAARRPILPM